MFEVVINSDSVHLMDGEEELIMWTEEEWREDPSVTLSIVNAAKIGYTQGSGAVRAILAKGRGH